MTIESNLLQESLSLAFAAQTKLRAADLDGKGNAAIDAAMRLIEAINELADEATLV